MRDPIADLRSPGGSLISLYADRPSPGGFGALLTDLVRPLRDQAEVLGRDVQMSVRADAGRIHDLADRLEFDSAPAYAIFASDADDLFVLESLAHPTPNVATIGPRPYLRPLRAAPKPLRAGILVADRALARTFVSSADLVEEIGSAIRADTRRRSFGGFSGYEEHGVRSRADEATSRMWREAGARLLQRHLERKFDYIAVGSHEETIEEISRSLHPYLDRLHRATFVAGPGTLGPAALRSELTVLDTTVRQERQEALAGRVCDIAWSGGNALIGLSGILDASNAQAVDTLVVAGGFTRPGAMCNECGHLARDGRTCPNCGSTKFAVADVVAALMEATVAAGGDVHQIDVPSPLDVQGVGATTRFPVPV